MHFKKLIQFLLVGYVLEHISNLPDCLHKCMESTLYKTACNNVVFLMMNMSCWKHVEDKKN